MNFYTKHIINLENSVRKKLNEKYNNSCNLDIQQIDVLIFNKNTHYSSLFKDQMVFDFVEEFFKRYYFGVESLDRIPKMAKYYLNYLNFFCKPIFRDFYANKILKRHGENRAELYYARNYGKEDYKMDYNSNLGEKKDNLQILLTTTIKENINRNSINADDNSNSSHCSYNFSKLILEESINKSGLLTKRSNKDESLVNILFQMDPLKMNEQFLVKDKMNKKSLFINHSKSSNNDKTTKDNSTKTHKEIINTDSNKLEIKDTRLADSERHIDQNNQLRINIESATANQSSPIKYSRINEFKILNLCPNNLGPSRNNKNSELKSSNSNNSNTKSKKILQHKSRLAFTQAYSSNIYSSQIKEKTRTFENKFLENIQNEALKALQKIKKTKLEFKNLASVKDLQNEIKVIYLDTNTNTNTLSFNPTSFHTNNNDNISALNDVLRLSLNNQNSRNRPNNETKTDYKPTVQCTKLKKNKFSVEIETSRIEKNNIILPCETSNKINLSNSISKSPINKDIPSGTNLNLNIFKNLADKTKTMSRNKNTSLHQMNSNKTKFRNEKSYKEKDSDIYNVYKSHKSLKKDKSIITTTVNLNIHSPDIHELEKKIYGTCGNNYKIMADIVNKNLKGSNNNKKSLEKDKKNINVMKSVNNLVYSTNNLNSKNITSNSKSTTRISNNLAAVTKSKSNSGNINQITASNLAPSKKIYFSSKNKMVSVDLQVSNKKKSGGVGNINSSPALYKNK